MLPTLIAQVLFTTFGHAFDSQCNNKDIFWHDSRGKQCAKEMLHSDQGNLYMNPLKSETNDSSVFKQLSVPIPRDDPASFMSIFLSQLMVVPTSSFLHFTSKQMQQIPLLDSGFTMTPTKPVWMM